MTKNIATKYTCFLCDWDGCLANSLEIWMNNYLKLYKEFGINTTRKEIIKKSWGNWEKGPINLGVENSVEFVDKLSENVSQDMKTVKLSPNAKKFLISNRATNKKTAIVTSSSKHIVKKLLKFHKIEQYIDCLLASEDVEQLKPNPEMLLRAMEILNADKNRSIMIGDTDKDMLAGENAGIDTALYFPPLNELYYNGRDKMKISIPTYIIQDFAELF